MKSMLNRYILFILFSIVALQVYAQYDLCWKQYHCSMNSHSQVHNNNYKYGRSDLNPYFFVVDWQINGVIDNNFVDDASVWGTNLEAGYYLTENWAVGVFFSYQTNEDYIPRQSYIWENSILSTDQIHSIYQMPFGLSARYRFTNGIFAPYAGLKIGAQYTETESYMNNRCIYNEQWGFYLSPEVGVDIHPFKQKRLGLHLAVYYNYATNDNSIMWYDVKGLNNYGLRLGFVFQ